MTTENRESKQSSELEIISWQKNSNPLTIKWTNRNKKKEKIKGVHTDYKKQALVRE